MVIYWLNCCFFRSRNERFCFFASSHSTLSSAFRRKKNAITILASLRTFLTKNLKDLQPITQRRPNKRFHTLQMFAEDSDKCLPFIVGMLTSIVHQHTWRNITIVSVVASPKLSKTKRNDKHSCNDEFINYLPRISDLPSQEWKTIEKRLAELDACYHSTLECVLDSRGKINN